VVHAQDSPGDDLGQRVFDYCAAGTISDCANCGVARFCHVGTKLKALNDSDAQTIRACRRSFPCTAKKDEVYRKHAVSAS
jgi:hypothetical protein